MPVEVGAFFSKPTQTVRYVRANSLPPVRDAQGRTIEQRPDPSFGPVDMRTLSRPMPKHGLIYYVDENAGLLILKYSSHRRPSQMDLLHHVSPPAGSQNRRARAT